MNIVLSGYGKMGRMIEEVLEELNTLGANHVIYHTEDICSLELDLAKECVCIDFTTPEAFKKNYKFLADNFKAVIIGTTGWNDIRNDVISYFQSVNTTMIYGSNFSIGVNILFRITELCSRLISGYNYSSHLKEIHHIHKLDKPSGTAVTIANIMEQELSSSVEIEALREGEVPGTHVVSFENSVDKITISHEAFSRVGFARGAVEAALMTENLSGVYEFKDLIK